MYTGIYIVLLHSCTILFLDALGNEVDLEVLRSELFARWSRFTSKYGFGEVSEKAFTLQDASKVKDYLNKLTGERYTWGVEDELTKLHMKKAKGESFVPFDFLRECNIQFDPFYVSLFKEFATAFHGKMHLTWSEDLKARYVVSDKTDEEIALSIGEEVSFVLEPLEWFAELVSEIMVSMFPDYYTEADSELFRRGALREYSARCLIDGSFEYDYLLPKE